jgi:hypothetical protein
MTKIASRGEAQRWIDAHMNYNGPGCLIWPFSGAAVRGAKLSESDVLAIRSAKHIPQKDLAAMYGVARSTLSQIMNHKRWSWL